MTTKIISLEDELNKQLITNGLASVGLTDATLAFRFPLSAFSRLTGLRLANRPNAKPQTVIGYFSKKTYVITFKANNMNLIILCSCVTDWIQAVAAIIAVPGAIAGFIFLFRKDKDKEEQIKQLTEIVTKFDAQNTIIQEGNNLIGNQVNILQGILISQIKAGEGAVKLADIEEERFLLSIRPKLFSNGGKIKDDIVEFFIENYGEVAYIKSIRDISENQELIIRTRFPDSFEVTKQGYFIISTVTKNGGKANTEIIEHSFEIEYFDKAQNVYQQNVYGTVGKKYNITEPKLIMRAKI